MTFGQRVKTLRQECGLTQEAFGAQGFVSQPGWVKIENGQRQASEKLIEKLMRWLAAEKHVKSTAVKPLHEELLTLKYLESKQPFLRDVMRQHAQSLPNGAALLAVTPKVKPVLGRPRLKR